MSPVRLRWRTLLLVSLLAAQGCAWLFHKPRPDADLPASERPWRVRCDWIVASPERGKAPETGWLWASDTGGRRLIVTGTLEDGFLRADALQATSDEDDRDVVRMDASSRAVTDACAATVARTRPGEQPHIVTLAAAREGENVEVTLVFPNDQAAPQPVSRLVVFGDSLSDPGNLKQRL